MHKTTPVFLTETVQTIDLAILDIASSAAKRTCDVDQEAHSAPTLFLLMAQYSGRTVVPLDQVCRDFSAT